MIVGRNNTVLPFLIGSTGMADLDSSEWTANASTGQCCIKPAQIFQTLTHNSLHTITQKYVIVGYNTFNGVKIWTSKGLISSIVKMGI